MNDGGTAGAVTDQDERASGGGESAVKGGDPVGATGSLPIFLLHSLVVGMMRLPDALPVLWTGVIEAGDEKDWWSHGFILTGGEKHSTPNLGKLSPDSSWLRSSE
jgi:hypothetical protein